MFNNIGGKIKVLAKVLCWIGIIASIITGIVLIGAGSHAYGSTTLSGILTLILGPLFSWIGSFVLYGFGTLVENSERI